MKKTNFIFSHSATLSMALLTAALLSGCAMTDTALDNTYEPYGGSDVHPITVVKGPVTMEVSSAQGSLQPPQINAVTAFVHQAMQAGITPITVAQPSGGGKSARVVSEIASLMVQQGVPRAYVRFASYSGGSSSPVRLSYVSTYAKTLKCGAWPEDGTDTAENQLTTNHGCAVQANIAAEIADPSTLVVPAVVTPIQSANRVGGLDTAFKPSSPTGSTSGGSSTTTGGPQPTP